GCGAPVADATQPAEAGASPITDVASASEVEASTAEGGCALQAPTPRSPLPPYLLLAALALLRRASQSLRARGSVPRAAAQR
ncbi:MAG TPA: hypothetical protein VG963_19495, partial [Polyangiaceae bacterium]|nr:hypothetical protein [Polyangiaceae bacterium]